MTRPDLEAIRTRWRRYSEEHDDIPALLAYVEELTRERDAAIAQADQLRMALVVVEAARDDARAEVEKLSDSAKDAWEAECIMRGQRDQYAVALKQERHEVARLQAEAAPMNEHFTAGYRDGSHDAFRRGAEAMRLACQQWCRAWENNGEDIADALADLQVEYKP